MDLVMKRVKNIRNRTKCFDIFHLVKLRDMRMYPLIPINKLVNYRVTKKKMYLQCSRMNLMKNLKAFSGFGRCTYLEIVLREIQLVKQIFILDLTMGDEVIVPYMLQMSKLPLSYRFYDPTLKMVQEMTTKEQRDFFGLKYKLNMHRIADDSNFTGKLLEMTSLDK